MLNKVSIDYPNYPNNNQSSNVKIKNQLSKFCKYTYILIPTLSNVFTKITDVNEKFRNYQLKTFIHIMLHFLCCIRNGSIILRWFIVTNRDQQQHKHLLR